jgi:hypothetical protein
LTVHCTVRCTVLLYCQVNAKISKTTHLKEMNFEIEKLKQMLIATREKNGEMEGVLRGACLPGLGCFHGSVCLPTSLPGDQCIKLIAGTYLWATWLVAG